MGLMPLAASSQAVVRVALMDFSTADNSYRTILKATDFTSLVQSQLAGTDGIEWVERAQLHLARSEFALGEMLGGDGAAALQRGRLLGANWLVKGHFSTDDQERPTLTLQVIELEHADVIASETVVLPVVGVGETWFGGQQAEAAGAALRQLLQTAKTRLRQEASKARVAFLFLADVTASRFSGNSISLEPDFRDALEQRIATNDRLRLIQFPKSYQSTEEAELVGDGFIQPDPNSWRRTADLYVWGTYSVTNARAANRIESKLNLTLFLWDGVAAPVPVTESVEYAARSAISPERLSALIGRLVDRVVSAGKIQTIAADSTGPRKQIADSIVQAYIGMRGRSGEPGLDRDGNFAQLVRMLETACFFDPDNAAARVLWVTCRYGWWIDFGHDVKNQFWTKWRRSQAWADYVERFGLKPATVELPFPYDRKGISATYVGSLADVIEMFPQWDDLEEVKLEAQWRKQGVHTWLVEAERHGFPTDVPHDLAFRWRQELERELARRKKQVADYSLTVTNLAKADVRQSQPQPPVVSNTLAEKSVPNLRPPVAPRGSPASGYQMVTAPAWLKDFMAIRSLFRLYPPQLTSRDAKPGFQKIEFPRSYEVQVVNQMEYRAGQLWILALDERSAPSSDSKPDLAAERLEERNRLWTLEPNSPKPTLYQPASLPVGINSFLFDGDQLWLIGKTVSVWDLKRQQRKDFGLADGLAMKQIEAITKVGGRMVVAGGSFELATFEPKDSRWVALARPQGRLSHGTGSPYLLTGNNHTLGYVAGGMFFQNLTSGNWTNVPAVDEGRCFAVAGEMFWIGARNGLHAYAAVEQSIFTWNAPAFIESPMISISGNYFSGNQTIQQQQLDDLTNQVLGRLRKMEHDHRRIRVARLTRAAATDPLKLTSRIPGRIAALVNDGDFLWVGADNYFGSYLLLLHTPSHSLVGAIMMAPRNRISSLAVSDQDVWIGTSYGDDALLRLPKQGLMATPTSQWKDLTLTQAEREQLVGRMSRRDQALYAFYAGDNERVIQLLVELDPKQAGLEEMFLLAWSYGAVGVDDLSKANEWYQRIQARHPDSPWATAAAEAARANQSLYAKFDLNRNEKLELSEKQEMLRDEDALGLQDNSGKHLAAHLNQIFTQCDGDGDKRLNRMEMEAFWRMLPMYFYLGPTGMSLRFRADTNKDSYLDVTELKLLQIELENATKGLKPQ